MNSLSKRESLALFIGDIAALVIALWATLLVRYSAFPEWDIFYNHVVPFSFLFLLSAIVFFIAGLYDRRALLIRGKTSETILYAQLVNILFGAVFFFLVPYFGIQPKTNLFIYLFLSSGAVIIWRLYLVPYLRIKKRSAALLIGSGSVFDDLFREVNEHELYPIYFVAHIKTAHVSIGELRKLALEKLEEHQASLVVLDVHARSVEDVFPNWYRLMLHGVRFMDVEEMYEQFFDRVALPLLEYRWFIEHAFNPQTVAYSIAKRALDIGVSSVLGIVSLLAFPFIMLAIWLDDAGPYFYIHTRIGKDNKPIRIFKFRTMSTKVKEQVTRVGFVLRKYRLDELPQLWNVFWGDLSLIGPRPELPRLVEGYGQEISFYDTRHLVQPGLSGWAQINEYDAPRGGVLDVEKTKVKLAYDLYYVKHRSFLVDLEIALKTVRALLSRSGT